MCAQMVHVCVCVRRVCAACGVPGIGVPGIGHIEAPLVTPPIGTLMSIARARYLSTSCSV